MLERIVRDKITRRKEANKPVLLKGGGGVLKAAKRVYPYHSIGPAPILQFDANLATNLKSYSIDISPVQDLHGYDSPWPAGGGKNKLNAEATESITVSKTFTFTTPLPVGTYVFSFQSADTINTVQSYQLGVYKDTSASWGYYSVSPTNKTQSFTITETCSKVVLYSNKAYSESEGFTTVFGRLMIEAGSTATAWEPYSNICPITGWTGAEVTRTDGQDPPVTSDTYSITFPSSAGTVYGGTLTVQEDGTGTLTVDKAMLTLNTVDMDNNNDYPGWRDTGVGEIVGYGLNVGINEAVSNISPAIAEGGRWAIGVNTNNHGGTILLNAQYFNKNQDEWIALGMDVSILFPFATPQTYTLTAPQISTLLGSNVMWADAGEMSAEYYYKDTTAPTPKEKALMWWRWHLTYGQDEAFPPLELVAK